MRKSGSTPSDRSRQNESATLSLNTVDLQISLSEIYEKVNFADSNDEE